MKNFLITIEESLIKNIIVEAETEEEAVSIIREAYDNGKITLSYDNSSPTKIYEDSQFLSSTIESFKENNIIEIYKKEI